MRPRTSACLGLVTLGSLVLSPPIMAMPLSTGFYLGLMVDGSHTNDLQFSTVWPSATLPNTVTTTQPIESRSHYKFGGGGGGQIGYRAKCFRLEGEILYASNKLSNLNGSVTSGTTTTNFSLESNAFAGLNFVAGHAVNEFALLNFFYDLRSNADRESYAPYVGIGVGYGRTSNAFRFEDPTNTIIGTQQNLIHTGGALQGIIGLTYEMDSEVSLYLDFRYIGTGNLNKNNSHPSLTTESQLATINIGLNFMFADTTYS